MVQFHKPRLSSAVVFALLYINPSSASPVAAGRRFRGSITGAIEPVNIIPVADLPELSPPTVEAPPVTTDDGTTLTTTYNIPRDVARNENSLEITSASAPVHIIPTNELPPGINLNPGNSTTTNDGTTVTTTFARSRIALQKPSNSTSSLDLLSTNTLNSGLNMGMNCEGSKIMCLGAAQAGVMHTLRDYMYAIPHGYHYYDGQKIACMKHSVYPWITWGFYCAFMQGNIPAEGFDGSVIQLKMQQMVEHGCLGCGSVPFSADNDPNIAGILTVNYVHKSECEGLCYYVPPGTPESAVKVPEGMTLASS